MNHVLVRLLGLALMCTSAITYAVAPYYSIRSQSVDAARELVGWAHKVNLYDMEKLYGTFAITLEGTGSFNPDQISECLFGINNSGECCNNFQPSAVVTGTTLSCCCFNTCCDGASVIVSGSQVPNRNPGDWLADYFGLSPNFQSIITFKPRVHNFILDFNLYIGLDEWFCGAYFRIHAPAVWTHWDLHACESVLPVGTLAGYPAGYFGPVAVPADQLVSRALDFFTNGATPNLGGGVTFQSLAKAKFGCKGESKTALAEIQMALGWNFWLDENYHLGANFRLYAPTGNRPRGNFLFEPIVGNGKHWEIGAGITGHYTFWRSEDEDTSFGVYVDANLTTMLRARQTRTFDITGRPLSRYMLAEKMVSPVGANLFANPNPNTTAGGTAPAAQFANIFTPVANLTTVDVRVRTALQADVAVMLNYTACNFEFDLGYNFWARTCEKIDLICGDCCATKLRDGVTWALKGDAFVYGFAQTTAGGVIAGQPIALSATQSNATINTGTDFPFGSGGIIPERNPVIDNGQFATSLNDGTAGANILFRASGLAADQTRTSLDPVFLNEAYIALPAARTQGMSHKVFGHVSYTWRDNDCWMPYLGVGGKAEFAAKHRCGDSDCCGDANINCNPIGSGRLQSCAPFTDNDCGGCQRCNLSEWGVWIKGGISFN